MLCCGCFRDQDRRYTRQRSGADACHDSGNDNEVTGLRCGLESPSDQGEDASYEDT